MIFRTIFARVTIPTHFVLQKEVSIHQNFHFLIKKIYTRHFLDVFFFDRLVILNRFIQQNILINRGSFLVNFSYFE